MHNSTKQSTISASDYQVLSGEANIHRSLCAYVKRRYPSAIFTSESAGVRLTMGQAMKAKALRSSRGLPDFWLAEARGGYFGFFMELKRSPDELYTCKGDLRINGISEGARRIREQLETIEELQRGGYFAAFGQGLKHALGMIDAYMASPKTWISPSAPNHNGGLHQPEYRIVKQATL